MSVIVMGMEMPKRCLDCRLHTDEYGCMAATAEQERQAYFDCKENGTSDEEAMYKLCPLRPLPEKHGRLIDESEVRDTFGVGYTCNACKLDARNCQYEPIFTRMDICGWLDDMETIVEAEGD